MCLKLLNYVQNPVLKTLDAGQLDFVYQASVLKSCVVLKSTIFMIRHHWEDKCYSAPKCITSSVCCWTHSSVSRMLPVSCRQECQIIINTTPAGTTQKPLLIWAALPVSVIGWLPCESLNPLHCDWWSYSVLTCWVFECETANLWKMWSAVWISMDACVCVGGTFDWYDLICSVLLKILDELLLFGENSFYFFLENGKRSHHVRKPS